MRVVISTPLRLQPYTEGVSIPPSSCSSRCLRPRTLVGVRGQIRVLARFVRCPTLNTAVQSDRGCSLGSVGVADTVTVLGAGSDRPRRDLPSYRATRSFRVDSRADTVLHLPCSPRGHDCRFCRLRWSHQMGVEAESRGAVES